MNGERAAEESDSDCIKFEVRISFNADTDAHVREENRTQREAELADLLSTRNYLAHRFGLDYPLRDEDNCKAAMTFLAEAKAKLRKQADQLNTELQMFESIRQKAAVFAASPDMRMSLERFCRLCDLKGKIGKLKSYDFSDIAERTVFDFTDQQDVIDAVLYGEGSITQEAHKAESIEVRLAALQCLADLSMNPNFMAAVRKQQQKRGIVIPE